MKKFFVTMLLAFAFMVAPVTFAQNDPKALAEPDWGLVGVGLVFAAVSYGWYRFWGMFTI